MSVVISNIGVDIPNNIITFRDDVNQTSQRNIAKKYSSTQQVYTRNNRENKNMSLARKLGIGFASLFAIIYAVGMGLRRYNFNRTNIKDITKELSKVFKRELSEKETTQMISRYEELMKIDDAETFIRKAFEQVKKDYGYEKADIPLSIKYENMWKVFFTKPFKKVTLGAFNYVNPRIEIVSFCTRNNKIDYASKLSVIERLYHELKHMEQSHTCYLKDKEKFFNSLIKQISQFEKIDKLNELNINYNRAFKNVPKKDISKYNDTIDELIKNYGNYKSPGVKFKEYKNQIIEEEAHNAGKIGTKFMWLNKSSLFFIPKGFINCGLIGASALCFAKDGYDTYNKTNY